ncbi:uncharacterized protein B0P05DRAFT_535992 [Gilbertella persicaria]|uniref:uncharacterized protein n=1 Tax=Gilbertella persicaria TaxID=101096 RepID=UPI00221F1492|nr:uncharacterized protein B0P05DRAFT_535992 [Gilbertella persicaria]KAI8084048.1 hypothetical protein B0P05DRAFT_535992 [Gilbertella persicaria]
MDELVLQTFRWMFWSPLVKDDVFLAPSSPSSQHDFIMILNEPPSSSTTIPTPCLSPVTSPSDFLCDSEPLFEGLLLTDVEEEDVLPSTPCSIEEEDVPSEPVENKRKRKSNGLFLPSKKAKCRTVFERLTESGIDWCRYCGTTEGVNWRPGPWGKRTLCNKHGCDYKGYGLASRLPRLDLSAYTTEKLSDRRRPIVQQFCTVCQSPELSTKDKLIPCQGGCSRAYHQHCYHSTIDLSSPWYCTDQCQKNKHNNLIAVDLPRKYLPLMRPQKPKHA